MIKGTFFHNASGFALLHLTSGITVSVAQEHLQRWALLFQVPPPVYTYLSHGIHVFGCSRLATEQ